jgi:hypothetical protein
MPQLLHRLHNIDSVCSLFRHPMLPASSITTANHRPSSATRQLFNCSTLAVIVDSNDLTSKPQELEWQH